MRPGPSNTSSGLTTSTECCRLRHAQMLEEHATAEQQRADQLAKALAEYK